MPTDPSINSAEGDEPDLPFEYVLGTLRGEARADFEKAMREDHGLQDQVAFWQEYLQTLQDEQPASIVPEGTWQQIEAAIQTPDRVVVASRKKSTWWQWLWAPAAAFSFAFLLWGATLFKPSQEIDYLAVLTSASGEAALTAITYDSQAVLQLQFGEGLMPNQPDRSLQLWARSRRDNQIRPLFVIDSTRLAEVTLSEAQLRLIRDAESLILSVEEAGGSPIDEPSDDILARGPCVRMVKT